MTKAQSEIDLNGAELPEQEKIVEFIMDDLTDDELDRFELCGGCGDFICSCNGG